MMAGFFLASVSAVRAGGLADQIEVVAPYVRLAPPGAQATGAFMTIRNTGNRVVRLVKAECVAAQATELHEHINDQGVMRMRQVPAIELPAMGESVLKPGGYHVMLLGMKQPLQEGEAVVMVLGFDDGSSTRVSAVVKNPLAGGVSMGGMDPGKMKH